VGNTLRISLAPLCRWCKRICAGRASLSSRRFGQEPREGMRMS